MAERAVLAHLEKLREDGVIEMQLTDYRISGLS